jgi:hypothetical protein
MFFSSIIKLQVQRVLVAGLIRTIWVLGFYVVTKRYDDLFLFFLVILFL